jgi:hypothetical protein
MPIVTKSNGIIDRRAVCQYLEDKIAENPGFRVLDIGGSANSWCDKYVHAYVDILPALNKTTYLGDINAEAVWLEIAQEKWDFCICTHVLEDIRAPDFVIGKIQEIFPAGFISMPNKHAELSHVESRFFLGWSHHRWIYTIDNDQLKAIAKMPIVQFFSQRNRLYHLLCSIPGVARVLKFRKGSVPALDGRLKWIDPKISRGDCELAFIWQEGFPFSFINNDFAGLNTSELARLYLDDLSHGL